MNKETFYFSHDHNAHGDPKVEHMLFDLGWESYGVYWALIEKLAQEPSHKIRTNYERIGFVLRCKDELIKSVVESFDLFVIDDGFFYSNRLMKHFKSRDDKSQKARESIAKRWEKDTNVIRSNTERNTIKERKGKEKKGKEELKSKQKDSPLPDSDLLKLQKLRGHEYFKNPRFKELWEDFCRSRGQKYTIIAKKNALMKLFRYDLDICITSIENSVSNGYLGLFPEKVNLDKNKPKQQQFLTAGEKTELACKELRAEHEARKENYRDVDIKANFFLKG